MMAYHSTMQCSLQHDNAAGFWYNEWRRGFLYTKIQGNGGLHLSVSIAVGRVRWWWGRGGGVLGSIGVWGSQRKRYHSGQASKKWQAHTQSAHTWSWCNMWWQREGGSGQRFSHWGNNHISTVTVRVLVSLGVCPVINSGSIHHDKMNMLVCFGPAVISLVAAVRLQDRLKGRRISLYESSMLTWSNIIIIINTILFVKRKWSSRVLDDVM